MSKKRPEVQPGETCYVTIEKGVITATILLRSGNLVTVEDIATKEVHEVQIDQVRPL